jgi:arylsulfatase A-like enzyme
MKAALSALSLLLIISGCGPRKEDVSPSAEPPNFVVIFCDDLGYGDLGIYGHPTIRTPRIDRMAETGQKWTNFYVGASVCTPSRAALLTGRLPIRSGMCSNERRVLFPDSAGGLPDAEVTIAEALRDKGYTSACVGKWHLGHLPQYLPLRQGFDYYFGLPYSNDMDRDPGSPPGRAAFLNPRVEYWNVPLIRNDEAIERPADQTTLTKRYTGEVVRFIEENRERPFFVYLAHSLPHVPLFRSPEFEGTSLRGLYGDVVEEIDWSVGRILDTLDRLNLSDNTLVVFTSDNGPWLTYDQQGGSAGLLRGGKGGTYEGGMREPAIFRWPGRIQPEVVPQLGSTLDLLPTFVSLAGAAPPENRTLDGFDLSPVLFGTGPTPREEMFYYRGSELFAVRHGPYKAHFITQPEYSGEGPTRHDPPLLFNLESDPSEKYDLSQEMPQVVEQLTRIAREHQARMEPGRDQLEARLGE